MHRNDVHLLFAPVAMAFAILVATRGGPFVQVAVLVLLAGAAIRWPAPVGRLHPLTRAIVLLCLFVALQAGWFLYGWTVYRPMCLNSTGWWGPSHYELIGPLSPEAVAYLTRDDSPGWRANGENGVLVRPAMRMIWREILWNNTSQAAGGIAETYGLAGLDWGASDRCDAIERLMMKDGRALYRSEGWGLWPYTTIDENGPLGRWIIDRELRERPLR